MQETVLDRFKNAVSFLLESKIASKKKEIASSCGVTPNYLSGVLYERISLSGDLVQRFLSNWPINPAYLTCQSDEIEVPIAPDQTETIDLTSEVTTNVAIIRLINKLKSDTINQSDRLAAGDELSELFAQLLDENINLRNDLMQSYQVIKNIKL